MKSTTSSGKRPFVASGSYRRSVVNDIRQDVTSWPVDNLEAIGLDEKLWLREPDRDRRWLFKPVVEHATWWQDEDWSERAASLLGRALGVPCAEICLASRYGHRGCLSLDVAPKAWELQPGAVLLSAVVPDYVPGNLRLPGRPGHSLANIQRALIKFTKPPGSSCPDDFDAFDTFAGYLVLDALIANRDRHDENWAVLFPPRNQTPPALAASFDHATSLGYNLRDSERMERLKRGTVADWALKGTAWRIEHVPGSTRTLVEVAAQALAMVRPTVRGHWLKAVAELSPDSITGCLSCAPELSESAVRFAERVVMVNRGRVLSEC
jgi:hypothetical protein